MFSSLISLSLSLSLSLSPSPCRSLTPTHPPQKDLVMSLSVVKASTPHPLAKKTLKHSSIVC